MEKLATLWLTEIETAVDADTKSPGTLDAYRSIYRRHVKPALGEARVREVDTPVVDRWMPCRPAEPPNCGTCLT
jgi:hypothetical protein